MVDISERIMELALERYCCAQIVVSIGLEIQGKENQELVQAARGLCYGMFAQKLCGVLNGAACMLSLYNEEYASVLIPELVHWFENKYGGTDCSDLVGAGKRDTARCMEITAETIAYCFELLEKNDLIAENI